jgi:hypothetical protein
VPGFEERRRRQQLQVAVDRGEALLVVQHQLVRAALHGDREPLRIGGVADAESREHRVDRHDLDVAPQHRLDLAPLRGGEDRERALGGPKRHVTEETRESPDGGERQRATS